MATFAVASMPAHLALSIQYAILYEVKWTVVASFHELLHTWSIIAAPFAFIHHYLVAYYIAAMKANCRLLQLLAASSTLLSVVFFDQSVKIWWKLNQIESEVGSQ